MVNNNSSAHYKLRLFYYNPDDRRIIVPKRNPYLGWTLNFARPTTWVICLLALAAVIATATINNSHAR